MYVIVAGGGIVGGVLVRTLLDNKHDVVLIEQNKTICDKLYAESGVVAVNGGATSIESLNDAGIHKADVLVAATGSDADNLACAILAKSFEVPRIIVRMRNPAYKNAYRVAGVDSIIRVTDLMVSQMMMDIENPEVRRITSIGGGKADIFVVVVPEGAKAAGKSIKDIVEIAISHLSVFLLRYTTKKRKNSQFPEEHRLSMKVMNCFWFRQRRTSKRLWIL